MKLFEPGIRVVIRHNMVGSVHNYGGQAGTVMPYDVSKKDGTDSDVYRIHLDKHNDPASYVLVYPYEVYEVASFTSQEVVEITQLLTRINAL